MAMFFIKNKSLMDKPAAVSQTVNLQESQEIRAIELTTRDISLTNGCSPFQEGSGSLKSESNFRNYRLSSDPKKDLNIIRSLMITYQLSVKNNSSNIPMGTNREITKQLMGENPSQIVFITKDDPLIKNGEIIDRWGNPLFFHVVSSKSCDISSSGPDGLRGTFDDLVEKGPEKINYNND